MSKIDLLVLEQTDTISSYRKQIIYRKFSEFRNRQRKDTEK